MKTLIICSFVFTSLLVKAQDTIIFKNGTLQNAKVLEVGTTNVTYKKTENLDGPNYVAEKSQIAVIQYANGSRDVMPYVNPTPAYTAPAVTNNPAPVTQQSVPTNSAPSSTYVRPQVNVVVAPPVFYGGIGWGGWGIYGRPWVGGYYHGGGGGGYRHHHGHHRGW